MSSARSAWLAVLGAATLVVASPQGAQSTVVTFDAGSGTPPSYTEAGLTVASTNASPNRRVELGDHNGDGSPDLRNRSDGALSPYRFTHAAGAFSLIGFDVVSISVAGSHVFTSSSGATFAVTGTGPVILPAGFSSVTFVDWSETPTAGQSSMTIDNLVFSLSVCGNGVLEAGEACDDSSGCCSSSCQIVADGTTCDDGDVCATRDTCQDGFCTAAGGGDSDGDGFCDVSDNCPADANSNQLDSDGDGVGDACDSCPFDSANDADGDLVCGNVDNCPTAFNPAQADGDHDGAGDACDQCANDPFNDADGDGICGDVDNCPTVSNPNQADGDVDGVGDACDACPADPNNDADGDGICSNADNCPTTANGNQLDSDGDGIGNACDPCPYDANNDEDHDGICGDVDNCPTVATKNQRDTDRDGVGDACDNCKCVANPAQADTDNDGAGNACDDLPTVPIGLCYSARDPANPLQAPIITDAHNQQPINCIGSLVVVGAPAGREICL